MAIDMRQFHQTFFEESLEGLAGMETELLHLEKAAANNGHATVTADPDANARHAVHRAAIRARARTRPRPRNRKCCCHP